MREVTVIGYTLCNLTFYFKDEKISKIFKRLGIGFGIFVAVIIVAGVGYSKFCGPNSKRIAKKTVTEPVGTSTDKRDKITKNPAEKIVKKTVQEKAPAMPKINVNQEIPSEIPVGVKVAQEKPKGVPARPECYRIIAKIPEKVIKTLNYRGGFIVFNSLNVISAVEVTLKVNQYNNENYYALADEKGDVGFNYAVVEGDLNGQTRSSIKIFALGFIHDENEYVVLECPDVLAPKFSH